MYQWIFWRHAEAGFAQSDLERPLTERGWQQAKDSADWLQTQGVTFTGYSSEAVRGQQTLSCYQEQGKQLAGLNPDGSLAAVHQALATLEGENAVIVGHLPWINHIVSELLGQRVATFGYSSICWLVHDDEQWTLKQQYRF